MCYIWFTDRAVGSENCTFRGVEEIYMLQKEDFEEKRKQDLAFKLKKSLYGL